MAGRAADGLEPAEVEAVLACKVDCRLLQSYSLFLLYRCGVDVASANFELHLDEYCHEEGNLMEVAPSHACLR